MRAIAYCKKRKRENKKGGICLNLVFFVIVIGKQYVHHDLNLSFLPVMVDHRIPLIL